MYEGDQDRSAYLAMMDLRDRRWHQPLPWVFTVYGIRTRLTLRYVILQARLEAAPNGYCFVDIPAAIKAIEIHNRKNGGDPGPHHGLTQWQRQIDERGECFGHIHNAGPVTWYRVLRELAHMGFRYDYFLAEEVTRDMFC